MNAAPEGDRPVIQPIAELFRADVVALWATTYNLQLALFNEYLLRRLGDPPLNAVVLADRDRLDATLEAIPIERIDILGPVNRRWLLRGARIGNGRFHPKSYLALTSRTAKLLVGSGNLSTNGIDAGREVFTAFASGTPHGDAAISTWRAWMRRLIDAVDDKRLAERFADLEQHLPTATGPTLVTASPLWHNLDQPLAEQFCEAALAPGDTIEELIVTAPYYDENGVALGLLAERLAPKRLRIYLTESTNVDGSRLASRLAATGAEVEVSAYLPDRFTHAKLVGVVSGSRGLLLSGSANLSQAALTLRAGPGNVELAVVTQLTADEVRGAFLPPEVTTEPRPLTALSDLTFDTGDADPAPPPVRITTATLLVDGRIQIGTEPAPDPGWRLADHEGSQSLLVAANRPANTATTTAPLDGPLVHVVDQQGTVLSNHVVVDDPDSLAHALRTGERTGSERPPELTATDLDTPLGQALLWLHQNMIMDVSERAGGGAANTATREEATGEDRDETLWDRLEKETLARDPRAGTYARMHDRATKGEMGLSEPLIELLDAMRHRAPADGRDHARHRSLLQLLSPPEPGAPDGRASSHWSQSARIRVRTRNVLRRWAAAQTDPRLVWVDPFAPLGNLAAIATVFIRMWVHNARPGAEAELSADDLDDLWARWFRPFVGSGQDDGWFDRADITQDQIRGALTADFIENATTLCWLAIRPGASRRERVVAWQPYLQAALDRELLEVNAAVAEYLTAVEGRSITVDQATEDLLEAREFIDDRLWCDQTAATLGLEEIRLEATDAEQSVSVRLAVQGLDNPLHDPRLPRLVVAVRQYRSADGVAVFALDHDWRLGVTTGEPVLYLPGLDADALESPPLEPGSIERLAAYGGVLADLFHPSSQVA